MAYDPDKAVAKWSALDLDFDDWLAVGQAKGYCSEPVCSTHNGLPSTPEEEAEWEQGHDPCVPAVRLMPNMEELVTKAEH